jgi:putative ABC transport system permease protein
VNTARELVLVAVLGLFARKLRTALVVLGPALGVAAIIGIFGMSESARGDVKATLRELGTNLIVIDQGPGGSGQLPADALARVRRVSTVENASATGLVPGAKLLVSRESDGQITLAQTLQVRWAEESLPAVLELDVTSGRFLNAFDDTGGVQPAVLGAGVAALFAVEDATPRSILIDGELFGVVGVLEASTLLPEIDDAVLISPVAAARLFGATSAPSQIYLRTRDGTTEASASPVALAITYGAGGQPLIRVPSDLLAATAAVDETFEAIVLGLGALSLLVGAIGIANVMTISVIQRSAEIGVRRALGHTRALIAGQFLLESALIGLLGGIVGIGAGLVFVAVAAGYQGWVVVLPTALLAPAGALAVVVSVAAGVYPSLRAATLEPLEALRGV